VAQAFTGRVGNIAKLGISLLACAGGLALSASAAAAVSFTAQQTFATGTGPHFVAAGDINGDGKPDLLITNRQSNTVSVLINTTAPGFSTATFAAKVDLAVGSNPAQVAFGDLDGDGKPDLVVVNSASSNISILHNTTAAGSTTPSFAAAQTISTNSYPFAVVLADFDGDGKLDMIVANTGSNLISVYRNSTAAGSATYSFDGPTKIVTGAEPSSLAVADFNGDGKPDIVVGAYIGNLATVILNSTPAGSTSISFGNSLVLPAGPGVVSVATGDFNRDGKPDVAISNSFALTTTVYINKTASGADTPDFAPGLDFGTALSPASVAVADLDGDGAPDILAANQSGATASVLINTTAVGSLVPSFATVQTFTAGNDPVEAIAADINGDGRPDIIVANNTDNTYSVLLNTSSFNAINPNQHGITGSWYNPATSGQGLEIELFPNLGGNGQGLLFAGWFTYDVTAAGGQRWYALEGTVSSTNSIALLNIYAGYGGNFAAPPVVTPTQVGTATLAFNDCNHGVLTYTFYDGRSGTIPLTRLTTNVTCGANGDNGAAPGNYLLSGSWSQAETSGQGFVFDVNPAQSNFFAAWYTYAPTGQQIGGPASERWYTIQSGLLSGVSSISGAAIYATGGGIFDSSATPTPAPVGTADIKFNSCTSVTLKYTFTAGVNSGLSGTLNLTRTGPTPQGCTL
jgi:hypothetical protein